MRTVLITGAEGFAGSHVLTHLRNRGYEAVAGVRNRARKLTLERQNIRALVCDVTDAINVARVVASVRPDGIIHLAGIARPADAADEPLLAYQSIVTAWANILDAVRRSVPRARLVLASACDVYGDAGRDGGALSEERSPQPVSTFGSLKRTAENIAHTFYRDYHLNVTIARPFHYLGAHQPTRFFFGAVAQQLASWEASASGRELALPDLSCQRDLLHVQDVAAAYTRLLEDGRPNEIYNICSGQAYTCRQIVEAIATEFGLRVQLREQATESDGQIQALRGDNRKLREELHWEPTHSVQDAVRDLVASYRASEVSVAR